MRIAVVTPTRGRPERVRTMIDSALEAAGDPESIDLWFYVDDDDPSLPGYRKVFADRPVHVMYGPSDGVGRAWNRMARAATARGCELFMLGNDDLVFVTPDWDRTLREHVDLYAVENYICCWFFNDGAQGRRHAEFPILHRNWIEATGYLFPEIFGFWFHDTWITNVAFRLHRLHWIKAVRIQHHHFTREGGVHDATTDRQAGNRHKDRAIYEGSADLRIADQQKLEQAMLTAARPAAPRQPARS